MRQGQGEISVQRWQGGVEPVSIALPKVADIIVEQLADVAGFEAHAGNGADDMPAGDYTFFDAGGDKHDGLIVAAGSALLAMPV